MKEYGQFYKEVSGGEGRRCNYPIRLDTYGCGCQHDCSYCYAKSLLDFRGLWDNKNPSVSSIDKIRRKLDDVPAGTVLRLGGMTDCFQPIEKEHRITFKTIQELNKRDIHYLIVTKGAMVADEEYMDIYDPRLAHIQVSITTLGDKFSRYYEQASLPSDRVKAIERLTASGFDTTVRLSPFIPEFIDFKRLAEIKCDKILVEFLRVNGLIKKTFPINFANFTMQSGGYKHLPLWRKIELISAIQGYKEISVCEDVPEHWVYWVENLNNNPEDCCNLHFSDDKSKI